MMFNYVCEKDRAVFSVNGMDPSIRILPVMLDCPRCRNPISVASKWEASSEVVVLSAEDLFRAANGLGLPDVENASEARVAHLLTEGKFVAVKLSPVNNDRVIIETLTVKISENLYTLHFATSTNGATIYKVTNPRC